ncbi:MAG: HDOD domain-containing protein [Fuerstiella sp.]
MKTQTVAAGSTIADVARAILLSDDHELPVLPDVAVQLLKLTGDVNCELKDIVDLFKRDQSLTGHLLKIANSARYSSGQTVMSVQQAVARLGLLRVREVVMLISCQSRVFNVAGFEQDVRESFERSLATAAFAQEIARVRRLNVEDAFLCGLLHDIGRPMLLQALSDHRGSADHGVSDDEIRGTAERLRVAMAGKLIRSWELPARLECVIQHQVNPEDAAEFEQATAILNLAIDIATLALTEDADVPKQISHPMVGVLNLYPEDLASILHQQTAILEWVRSTV